MIESGLKLLNKSNSPIIRLLTKIGSSDKFPFISTYFLAKWRYPTRSKPPDTIVKVERLAITVDRRDANFILVCLRLAITMPKINGHWLWYAVVKIFGLWPFGRG